MCLTVLILVCVTGVCCFFDLFDCVITCMLLRGLLALGLFACVCWFLLWVACYDCGIWILVVIGYYCFDWLLT